MSETSCTSIINFKIENDLEGNAEKNFDHDNVVDILQTCRACACVNNYFIPIYDGEGVEHELGAKINQYLPINVSETDELPTQLCYQCASLLITWHEMFIGSLKAEEDLLKLKSRLDNEKSSIPEHDEGVYQQSEEEEMDSSPVLIPEQEVVVHSSEPIIIAAKPIGLKIEDTHFDSANDDSQDFHSLVELREERCTLDTSDNEGVESSEFHLCQACSNVYKPYEEFEEHNREEHNSMASFIKVIAPIVDRSISSITSPAIPQPITCQVCGLVLDSKKTLLSHIYSSHSGMDEGSVVYILKQHNLHAKKKPFECKLCHRKNYHQHLPNGQILKKYKCETCHKAFASKSEYQTHSLTHSQEKPYMCDICGKCFKVKNSLSNHVKYTHIRQRKFQCTYCGWTACRRYNLEVHIRRHTGLKPFACAVCGRRFTQKNDMLKHQTRHESEGGTLEELVNET